MQEEKQVIFRRFRPQKFRDVCQQNAVVTTLKNAIRLHRTSHAYLFTGSRGVGKTTLARIFAKALNCENPESDFEPCDQCPSCRDILSGSSLNVLEIDGASNRGIDDIRNLNEIAGYAPARGRYKIYIIDEVHMLTKEAFNALLKLLEEPPTRIKFFLATTEPHKILPTILSRCQRFDLERITEEIIVNKLQSIAKITGIHIHGGALQLIAKHADGSLRDAESILDKILCYAEEEITESIVNESLGLIEEDWLLQLDLAAQQQDLSFAFKLADQIFTKGKNLHAFLDALIAHYCAILRFQLGLSLLSTYEISSQIYSQPQCLYILDYLMDWSLKIPKSGFKRHSLEIMLLHIIKSLRRMPPETIAGRLIDLEKNILAANPSLTTKQAIPPSQMDQLPDEHNISTQSTKDPSQTSFVTKPKEEKVLREETIQRAKVDHDTLLNFAAVELNGVVKK